MNNKKFVVIVNTLNSEEAVKRKSGFNGAIVSMKSLIAILSVTIILLFFAADLSAQEKKDDKKWEITGYLGAGGRGSENRFGSTFDVLGFGVGLEYFLSPRISIEGQINYLPNISYALTSGGSSPGVDLQYVINEDEKFRLLWDINLLFYTLPTVSKRPMRLFVIVGAGYQYDRGEDTVLSLPTMEQYKYGYGSFWFQWITFGAGLKVNIKTNWSLKLLYKIHNFRRDEVQTNRLTLGLSYRF